MERAYRWFAWHPVVTGCIAGLPGLLYAGLIAAAVADKDRGSGAWVVALIFMTCVLVPLIALPLRWARRGVRIINGAASAEIEHAVEQIVSHACSMGVGFERNAARLCWLRSGRAAFIQHAVDHRIAPVFVTDRALGVCDYARFSLRSGRVTPCRTLTEVAYDDIVSVRAASRTHLVIALRTGLLIERATSDDSHDLAEWIRQRMTVRPAVPPPSPPPAANPPLVVTQRPLETEAHNTLRDVQAHLLEFEALRTYAAVPRWKRRAAQLASALKAAAVQARTTSDRASQGAALLRAARMKRFFLVRLFISKKPELAKRADAQRATYILQSLHGAEERLLDCIDYTPNDEMQRKALLKKLKLERKELRIRKRDVNAGKREIHRSAKEASASAGEDTNWNGEYYNPALAAEQRREIRRDRYNKLAPFEDKARDIEWRFREVERKLLFLERFGTDSDD
jgi:hypothetical protein